ncbi:TPA: SDR family oxidoreductase [Elizabethkingia anophelis]|uniref:SDR family oxidoreductase n=1 Tax=Elizabethkingia anophelis TaxID=1117645 RepID=UPI000665E3BD|nr:SDR family oxidoreductase [Elizabethkingia anophelis]AQW91747.1 short-chain dehydrogenase [Elizabethkingia anophelis]KUY18361.1 short-chain dehydrogenase [Elizabethkingia anophelis]MCT3726080.1 SDR family oxidoreductase [Elizabethkingia anophelis]MCT4235150.1 SDR family oxidoreductase [Elizabethkingia anophelis]MCT4317714.1 SDR family oxidoreductase [Elizabethkingia anophelis]
MNAYFNNKVIWITGASSGIGEALVKELAVKSNAKIILSSRREDQLYAIAQNAGLDKGRYVVIPVDLQNYTAMPTIAENAISKFGKIDILINNAGLSQRSLAMETSIEVDKRLMDIDFIGTVALTKAVVPYMIKNKGGQIVVVSSLMGLFGAPMRSGYAAAKHALHGFFEALRAELYNDKVFVTIVCPGFVKTNISINAVTGTGTAQNTMDDATANGIPVNIFAQKMLKAIAKQKYQAVIGGKETFGVYLKRFFPSLLVKIVRKAKVV